LVGISPVDRPQRRSGRYGTDLGGPVWGVCSQAPGPCHTGQERFGPRLWALCTRRGELPTLVHAHDVQFGRPRCALRPWGGENPVVGFGGLRELFTWIAPYLHPEPGWGPCWPPYSGGRAVCEGATPDYPGGW